MYACPHCNTETFTWRQRARIGHSSRTHCSKCGGAVRERGDRRLLLIVLGGPVIGLVSVVVGSIVYVALGPTMAPFRVGVAVLLLGKWTVMLAPTRWVPLAPSTAVPVRWRAAEFIGAGGGLVIAFAGALGAIFGSLQLFMFATGVR